MDPQSFVNGRDRLQHARERLRQLPSPEAPHRWFHVAIGVAHQLHRRAVSREFKVPKESVTPTGDTQGMRDGIYVVTLGIGPGKPAVNCTVNENGVVSDVIRAR